MPHKVLVTGASGMLGSVICSVLEEKGFDVIKERFDISSAEEVGAFAKKSGHLDAIVHCAALTGVNECEQDQERCYAVNVQGTKHIVDLARQNDSLLIYISTPMVFPGDQGNYREESPTRPLNHYAQTKLLGEKEVLAYKKGLVLRANPIGIRPAGTHPSFIQWFVDAARHNRSFSLFTDVRINPISTNTLASMISRLLLDFQPGILHLGSPDIANKAEVWEMVLEKFPNFSGSVVKESVDRTEAGQLALRPKEMWLNVEKAERSGYRIPSWKDEVQTVLKDLGL